MSFMYFNINIQVFYSRDSCEWSVSSVSLSQNQSLHHYLHLLSLHLRQCLQYHGSPELVAGEGGEVEDEFVEEERKLIDQC